MEPETHSQLKVWPKKIDQIRAVMTGPPILVAEVGLSIFGAEFDTTVTVYFTPPSRGRAVTFCDKNSVKASAPAQMPFLRGGWASDY